MKSNSPLVRREFLHIYGGTLVAALLSGCGGGSPTTTRTSPNPNGTPFPTGTPTPLPGGTPTPTPGGTPLPGGTPTPGGTPLPGEGEPNPDPTATPTPLPSGDSRFVVRPEVALLPSDGSVQITEAGNGAFVLRGVPGSLAVGSVLVSAAGEGLLRKVTAVRPEADGSVWVETVQGTLEDVFIKAQFTARVPVNASDVARIETIEGVEYIGPPVSGPRGGRSATRGRDFTTLTNFEFAIKSSRIMDTTEAEVNGKVKFKLEMEVDGVIEDGTLQQFTCVFHITPAAEIEFLAKKKFQKPLFKVSYANISLNPIVFAVGLVPVVIVPTISISAEMVGSMEGGVSFTCGFSVPARVGAKYTRAGGWEGVANASPTGNLLPKANAFAACKLEFNPVRVDVKTLLYGVAGPQLTLSAPSFEAKMMGKAGSDNSIKFTGAVGAKASVSVKVEVVGKEIAEYEKKDALEFKNVVYEKTFLSGGAEVEVL